MRQNFPGDLVLPDIPGVTLLREAAEGPISAVYEGAEEPGGRRVAVKLFKPLEEERDGRIKRFFSEAEILLKLSHPGVARLVKTGMAQSPDGNRYYHILEWVDGESLVRHADRHRLSTRQRIALMLSVCDAVAYLHRKGVLHRNLRPENILIEESGQPRLIDLGLARPMSGASKLTAPGQIVGNLTYMSPEQTLGRSDDLDERVDVYGLGGVGYTLLAGRPPLDFRGKTLDEAIRMAQEAEPEPLGRINPEFAGDVERTFARALAKDRAERHASVEEFAADLERIMLRMTDPKA